MRDGDAIAHIFDIIERIEANLALLKILVQRAISEEQLVPAILVDAEYIQGDDEQDALLEVDTFADAKTTAKSTKKERRIVAHQRAQEWAESEFKKKEARSQQS